MTLISRLCAGGNGKQIFGDAWWLEPEQSASLADAMAAQEIASQQPADGFPAHTMARPLPTLSGAKLKSV